MIQIENNKFKALGGVYNITYIVPYYFQKLKFKALGTVYNISVQEIDKYNDLIDYGGFKRKWIRKNSIGNMKINFNGKKYQSYNLNGTKPDLYFSNHAWKKYNILNVKKGRDKFDDRTAKWFYERLIRFKKKKNKNKYNRIEIINNGEVKEVITDNPEIRIEDNFITCYSNGKVTNYIPTDNLKDKNLTKDCVKIVVKNFWDKEYGEKIYG